MTALEGKDVDGPDAAIALSVCLCTFNRADDLAFALESLARLRIPQGREVEFIIVDNASTDATPEVLSAAAARFPFPLKIFDEPIQGLAAARNCALRHASGEVIAWTDDDCVPAEDWVERILAHFDEDPTLDFLTGRIELYDPSHYPITINTSLESVIFDESSAYNKNFVNGCNLVFRSRLIERLGVFDPRFGAGAPLRSAEDMDFAFRALRAGYRIAYMPDVFLYHNHKRITHDQVMRLRCSYAFGEGAMLVKHIASNDGMAARWLYWRFRSMSRAILCPTPLIPSRMDSMTLLLQLLAGGVAYLRFSLAHSVFREMPAPARGRDSRSFGSAS